MADKKDRDIIFRQARGWFQPDQETVPVLPPIYQSTTYTYPSLEAYLDAGSRMAFDGDAFFYTRYANPTVAALEKKLAELEGAEQCVALASGMAAITASILSQVKAFDMVVTHSRLYSSSDTLFHDYLPRLGFPVEMADLTVPENAEKALAAVKARIVYIETPANPLIEILDIQALAEIAHRAGALLIVDSTFASPLSQNPLRLGADLVVASATKYISGHDDAMGGYVAGPKDLIAQVQNYRLIFGPSLSPLNAWFLMRGLRTLALRLERIEQSATRVAAFLEAHPRVERVFYPGLPGHPGHALAKKQMKYMSGMIAFYLRGSVSASSAMLNNLSLIPLSVGMGDCATMIEHPASMTHVTVSSSRREALGITDNLVRLSVGLEDPDDIIADLDKALSHIGKD